MATFFIVMTSFFYRRDSETQSKIFFDDAATSLKPVASFTVLS